MNNVNANINTDKEEIKYLTIDDIDKMLEEAEPADCGYIAGNGLLYDERYCHIEGFYAKSEVERLPADHAKFLLDFYNLFDENEPYKDKEGTPYRDKLLNDLYYNIYEEMVKSDNGKEVYRYDVSKKKTEVKYLGRGKFVKVNVTINSGTEEIPILDKNQKIEKLKKSFDIFKRLKERDLILASIYDHIYEHNSAGGTYLAYHDYSGDEDTQVMFMNERALLSYIRYFFGKGNWRGFFFIKNNFPNVEITENMMEQYLEYKGR